MHETRVVITEASTLGYVQYNGIDFKNLTVLHDAEPGHCTYNLAWQIVGVHRDGTRSSKENCHKQRPVAKVRRSNGFQSDSSAAHARPCHYTDLKHIDCSATTPSLPLFSISGCLARLGEAAVHMTHPGRASLHEAPE